MTLVRESVQINIFAVVAYVRTFFVFRNRLALERSHFGSNSPCSSGRKGVPKLGLDRLLWIALRRLWPGWIETLIIVKPETVLSGHGAGNRLFWRLSSRFRRPGRPGDSPIDLAH
jgi:hypothetical protein